MIFKIFQESTYNLKSTKDRKSTEDQTGVKLLFLFFFRKKIDFLSSKILILYIFYFLDRSREKKKRRFKRILTRFNEMKRNITGLKPVKTHKVTKLV